MPEFDEKTGVALVKHRAFDEAKGEFVDTDKYLKYSVPCYYESHRHCNNINCECPCHHMDSYNEERRLTMEGKFPSSYEQKKEEKQVKISLESKI